MSKQIRMFIFSITIGIILHSQILSQGYPVYTLYSGSSWYYNPNVMYFGQSDGTPLGPNTKFRSLYTEINTYDTCIVVDSIYVSFLISNDVGTEPLTAYFTDFEDDNGSSQEIWDNIAN